MGRDQLFDLLRFHGLLIRGRKRRVRTTDSCHWLKKHPNLIEGPALTAPEQLWVSDAHNMIAQYRSDANLERKSI
jgi:putative transposase